MEAVVTRSEGISACSTPEKVTVDEVTVPGAVQQRSCPPYECVPTSMPPTFHSMRRQPSSMVPAGPLPS